MKHVLRVALPAAIGFEPFLVAVAKQLELHLRPIRQRVDNGTATRSERQTCAALEGLLAEAREELGTIGGLQ